MPKCIDSIAWNGWVYPVLLVMFIIWVSGCVQSPYQSYNKGVEFMISGYARNAESAFLDEVANNPKNAEAWNQLGIIAFEEENYELAKIRFSRAMELDSLNWIYPRNQALVQAELGNYQTAQELLQRSLELNSTDPQTHLTRAKIYLLQDKTENAQRSLDQTLQLDPGNEVALRLKSSLDP